MSEHRETTLIRVDITEEQKTRIRSLYKEMPSEGYNKYTFMKGKGGIFGLAGEIIVLDELGGKHQSTKDYDIIVDNAQDLRFCYAGENAIYKKKYKTLLTPKKREAVKIEVKSKRVTSHPKMEYENSVARFSAHQDCTHYVFVRVMDDLSTAWICGACTPQWFYKNATFHAKGDYDVTNNFTFHADCFNVTIGKTLDEAGYQKDRNNPFSERVHMREVWLTQMGMPVDRRR